MSCLFESEIEFKFEFDYKQLYEDVVDAVLDAEKCPYDVSVSLLLTGDEEIRSINNEMRNIDSATDVLSFPMNEYDEPSDFSKLEDDLTSFDPESGELILGDIVLSYDHIIAQANEYGHSIEREYAFLIAHSMLHLVGYDHMLEDERIEMENRQRVVMDMLVDKYPSLKVN